MTMANRGMVDRLVSGEAFADLSFWHKVSVSGDASFDWLNDLVTADLSGLATGHARQALFLSPTGAVRASFTVAVLDGSFLLVQDPLQHARIHELLEPYVLSSEVTLEDRTSELAILAFPGRSDASGLAGTVQWKPSCLGTGVDLVAAAEGREMLISSLSGLYGQAGNEELEAWWVVAGIARFGVDALEGDLPQEAGLSSAVSRTKGCFPGQEAVAKVDTLGHPRRLVLPLEAEGTVSPGDPVMLDGSEVGEITSVAVSGGRTLVLARLHWEARDAELQTGLGTELRRRAA
jgi:tRNA-modifying protein YgfZ